MKRALIPVMVLSLAVLANAQESLTLKYAPKEGKVYRYSNELKLSSEMAGQKNGAKIVSIQGMEVKKVTDAIIETVTKMEFVRLSSTQPQAEEAMAKASEDAKKQVITAQSDLWGTLIKTESNVKGGMSSQFNQVNTILGFGVLGVIYPKEPVTVGKAWVKEVDLKVILGAAAAMVKDAKPLKLSYTLKSTGEKYGRKTARIEWKLEGEATMGDPSGASSGKMSFIGQGGIDLDVLTGINFKSAADVTINIDATGGPQGQAMKMSQSFTVRSELLEPAKIAD